MFREYRALLVAAFIVGVAPQALAQMPAPAAKPPAVAQKPYDPNEVVCQKEEATGTRLGAKRVCMTRMQWADRRLQDRLELERVQVQRGTKGE